MKKTDFTKPQNPPAWAHLDERAGVPSPLEFCNICYLMLGEQKSPNQWQVILGMKDAEVIYMDGFKIRDANELIGSFRNWRTHQSANHSPDDIAMKAEKAIWAMRYLKKLQKVIDYNEWSPRHPPLHPDLARVKIERVLKAQAEYRRAIDGMTDAPSSIENLWDFRMHGDKQVKEFLHFMEVEESEASK